jgi:serine/threonine kinase 38
MSFDSSKFSLFQRPFSYRRKKSEDAGSDTSSEGPVGDASEQTKQKVAAAKSYIENMYKVQQQNIQERSARCGARSTHGTPVGAHEHRVCAHRRIALEQELRKEGVPEEEKNRIMTDLEKRESDYIRLHRQRLSAQDFEPLTIIGRGAFGEVCCAVRMLGHRIPLLANRHTVQVRIVREKVTNKIMAMKKLKKSEMVRRGQVGCRLSSVGASLCCAQPWSARVHMWCVHPALHVAAMHHP